jgi:hypothetical protein
MSDLLTPLLTRAALGLLEVVVARLLWRLWSDYARTQRAAGPAVG